MHIMIIKIEYISIIKTFIKKREEAFKKFLLSRTTYGLFQVLYC